MKRIFFGCSNSMSMIVMVGVLAACAPRPKFESLHNLDHEYEHRLLKWTMSGQVYKAFDQVLFVHATYLAPEFRQAFGDQYLSFFGIDPGRVDSDLEMIATSIGRGHEFFLYADMSNFAWNNLDEPESVWRMALWGGEEQLGVAPISITRFRGRGPNLQAFFPYINPYGKAYFVVFPLDQPNGKPVLDSARGQLTIKMSSAFGTATMNWKVRE